MEYPYEIVFMYYMDSGLVNCPAVYAHEILHCFGAPDLYMTDSEYAITDEFIGLTDDCSLVAEYKLGKSQHQLRYY